MLTYRWGLKTKVTLVVQRDNLPSLEPRNGGKNVRNIRPMVCPGRVTKLLLTSSG